MNYSTLVADKTVAGSIKRWVNYGQIDSETVLTEAQALIYSMLRAREMRQADVLTFVAGDWFHVLPTGFLDPIVLKDMTNNITLNPRTEAFLLRQMPFDSGNVPSGTPFNYTIYNETLVFDAAYDAAASLVFVFYKSLTALTSETNETNFLTSRYPHILRTACLAQAYNFMNEDEREAKALAKLAAYIQKANAEADDSYRGLVVSNEVA